jgi:hypothetical protein
LIGTCAAADMREAPNAGAAPVNQLSISGNACGPAALLASCRFGNESWQASANSLAGSTDKERLAHWIKRHGLRPSATLKGRMRWNSGGINAEDLVAAANEMNRPLYLPTLALDDLFRRKGEKPAALLKRTRDCMDRSLSRGFPPVLSLRRFVLRGGVWMPVQGHFVTITGVQTKIPKGETGIRISYIDPWGGKKFEGFLKVADCAILAGDAGATPCLVAEVPDSNIGKKEVKRGEETAVVPAAVIGRW